MAKRKRSAVVEQPVAPSPPIVPPDVVSIASKMVPPVPVRRTSSRRAQPPPADIDPNPQHNPNVIDAEEALRSSPDAEERELQVAKNASLSKRLGRRVAAEKTPVKKKIKVSDPDSSLSDLSDVEDISAAAATPARFLTQTKQAFQKADDTEIGDPEADGDEAADPEELRRAMSRPPAVNSSYLPLPWKGRLGYACLNTYLRQATPPVFSSRTCRIASILEHRHPLKDPSQPEHSTKNRPDKDQPADIARGQAYVEALGLANARDIPKMLRWNDRYNIKFMRLSSEMFPFASHDVYGYKLAPFASEALAEAGKVAAELGHRLTTHPGQFTQLGSPRNEVITASVRDLEYHCELLDLLKLPVQQDKDAVMILHMGGIFGDKAATIQRFRDNYAKLPQKVKDRLVLENDDVCYSVHDLLPVCEELNIPLVLDYHHNNIVFDADKMREGTLDIMGLYDRIKATWDRKGITQKMHYSEPCAGAVTARQRRKHNARVYSLPPCAPDMDLMIEAKDKEQAVFEVMRNMRLPGHEKINDILPYIRLDENKPWKPPKKKTPKKKKVADVEDEELEEVPQPPSIVPEEEVAMGGPEYRVYWPPGFEEWLRPKKREVKPRDPEKAKTTAEKAAAKRAEKAAWQAAREASAEAGATESSLKDESIATTTLEAEGAPKIEIEKTKSVYDRSKSSKAKPARAPPKKKSVKAAVMTPSTSDHNERDDEDVNMSDLTDTEEVVPAKAPRPNAPSISKRQSSRGTKLKAVNYAEGNDDE
ncbi:UV-damage endonuclease [Neophaeococcomyces mojaviensis]|uniref:UV-damage endonuclease n=1 Tax=Neophaeococcomyces mojaviensis TaxID=3383035 RepID=A0ACC3AAM2_9EURO|nr:UV-damage endonuclease [Knufia sp. JES_112]